MTIHNRWRKTYGGLSILILSIFLNACSSGSRAPACDVPKDSDHPVQSLQCDSPVVLRDSLGSDRVAHR